MAKKKTDVRRCEDCTAPLKGIEMMLCDACRERRAEQADDGGSAIEDMECPRCGHEGSFGINFAGHCTATHSGSDDDGDHEWDDKSACSCGNDDCSYSGVVKNFNREDKEWKRERKLALARLTGKEPPVGFKKAGEPTTEKYTVTVIRRPPNQYLRIPVHATSEEDARKKALEIAPNRDFKDGTEGGDADYDTDAVEKND